MLTVSSIARIPSTAAWSADSFSPRPTQRPAPIAAASVTRTSSSARFRSGAVAAGSTVEASGLAIGSILHPLRRFDPHQIEAARDHGLCRGAETEPERLGLALEHAVVVVEAVEVVGNPDRVVRNTLRSAPLRRLGHYIGELDQALDQILLLGCRRLRRLGRNLGPFRVAPDPGDTRVRVLDVVDRILLAPLRGEVDVDLDRLVRPAVGEVPARCVDTDLVHQLVEKDDVAAALRHLRLLAAPGQVDELV